MNQYNEATQKFLNQKDRVR